MKNFWENGNLKKKEGGQFPPLGVIEGNLGDDEEVEGVVEKGIKIKEGRKRKDQQNIDNSYK